MTALTAEEDGREYELFRVRIALEEDALHGDLQVPEDARGLVIFVHSSGSSRFSRRNRQVARILNQHGLATLLLDLLTEEEHRIDEETMQFRFDIPFLAARSTRVAAWTEKPPDVNRLPIGLFGASTGAAAALLTAAALTSISAVVSRGGRPDLAADSLMKVKAPTLLIVGGEDRIVLELNRKAMERMTCLTRLHVVPGATHLFEEQGALEEVSRTAAEWFVDAFTAEKHQAANSPNVVPVNWS